MAVLEYTVDLVTVVIVYVFLKAQEICYYMFMSYCSPGYWLQWRKNIGRAVKVPGVWRRIWTGSSKWGDALAKLHFSNFSLKVSWYVAGFFRTKLGYKYPHFYPPGWCIEVAWQGGISMGQDLFDMSLLSYVFLQQDKLTPNVIQILVAAYFITKRSAIQNRNNVTVFVRACHWFLSRAKWIQSILPYTIFLRCILLLSFCLCPVFKASCSFKFLCLPLPTCVTCQRQPHSLLKSIDWSYLSFIQGLWIVGFCICRFLSMHRN
jgi:hypothetical protein